MKTHEVEHIPRHRTKRGLPLKHEKLGAATRKGKQKTKRSMATKTKAQQLDDKHQDEEYAHNRTSYMHIFPKSPISSSSHATRCISTPSCRHQTTGITMLNAREGKPTTDLIVRKLCDSWCRLNMITNSIRLDKAVMRDETRLSSWRSCEWRRACRQNGNAI